MASNSAEPCHSTALTQLNGHPQPCGNPFCHVVVEIKSPKGKHGRYCSDRCRMDGYVLRRARAMLDEVGIVKFYMILKREGKNDASADAQR